MDTYTPDNDSQKREASARTNRLPALTGSHSRAEPNAKAAKPNDVLQARRLPGRLSSEQAASLLGFQPHDIALLCRGKLLQPLGNPAPNAPKYFAASIVEALARDPEWLSAATSAAALYWRKKNGAVAREKKFPAAPKRRSRYAS